MLSVIKTPPKVALAENPVVFGIRTNNNYVSTGAKAKLILYFGSVIYTGTGYQFSITFGGNTYTFTMAANPDGSALQFPRAATTDDNLSWMLKIKDALYSNFYISEWYDVSATYNQVVLTAKNTGSDYDITGANISVSGLSVSYTAGSNAIIRSFYRIFLQGLMGGSEVIADTLEVDASGKAYFDVSEYLIERVKGTFLFPETSASLMLKRSDMCRTYNIRYAESYLDNGAMSIKKLYSAGTFYVVTGGVNKMTQARYNDLSTSFFEQLQSNNMFLTWHPGNKKTAEKDIQKLYFLVHNIPENNGALIWLKAALKYKTSGSSVINTQIFTKKIINCNCYDVLEICCGYSRLMLDVEAANLPSGAWVTGYDIFLTDSSGNIISQVFSFLLDSRTYMNYRSFLFRNSLGAYETMRCTSVQAREADYENTVIQNYRTWNFTGREPENKKFSSSETSRFTINTGDISQREMEWSRELFMSKEVYEINNGLLYPIVIVSEKVNQGKDREFLYNVEFEYVNAFTDQHYSYEKNVMLPGLTPGSIQQVEISDNSNSIDTEINESLNYTNTN